MDEEKKFYELTEEERKDRIHDNWKKIKPYVKRILFALFCIVICLLMAFSLFGNLGKSGNSSSESAAAIIAKFF